MPKFFVLILLLASTFAHSTECTVLLLSDQQDFLEKADSVHRRVEKLLKKINEDWQNATPARNEAYRQVAYSWRDIKKSLGAPEHLIDWSPSELNERGLSAFFMLEASDAQILMDRFPVMSENLKLLGASQALIDSTKNLAKVVQGNNIYESILTVRSWEKLSPELQIKYATTSKHVEKKAIADADYNSVIATKFEVHATREDSLWIETVLENDFKATTSMKHSEPQSILVDGKLLGFEVTYSLKAKRLEDGEKGVLTVKRYFNKKGEFVKSKTLPEFVQ